MNNNTEKAGLPEVSTLTPYGKYNAALVAAPLSPLKVVLPVPANVVIIPVETVTLRIRWLYRSAMYTLPINGLLHAITYNSNDKTSFPT